MTPPAVPPTASTASGGTGVLEPRRRAQAGVSIDPAEYGADPSGLLDSTEAISTAMDIAHSLGRDVAFNSPGTYRSGSVHKGYAVNMFAVPGVVIQVNAGTSGELWSMEGSLGAAEYAPTGGVAEGANTLKVTQAQGEALIAEGAEQTSIILLRTTTQVPEGQAGRNRGQLMQLTAMSLAVGKYTLTFRETFYRALTLGEGLAVQLVHTIGPVSVEGFTFTNPAGANTRYISIIHGRTVRLIDLEAFRQQQPAVEVRNTYGFNLEVFSEYGEHDNTTKFGYTAFAAASSCHGTVNATAINGNYAFNASGYNAALPGEPYDIQVTGLADNSNRNGFGTHPEGHHITFNNVVVRSSGESGIEATCPNVTINNPTVSGTAEAGVRFATGATENLIVRGGTFNSIGGDGISMVVTKPAKNVTIESNTFQGIVGRPINTVTHLENYRQQNNSYSEYGTGKVAGSTYCWRHQKPLVLSQIQRETVNAEGANEKISQLDEAATKVLIAYISGSNVTGTQKWAKDAGGEAASGTGVESESGGVTYRSNFMNKP